jgi:hypothetical protein
VHVFWFSHFRGESRYSWLRHTRSTPPTDAEIEAELASRRDMKSKVASLEQADAKLRLQELAERHLQQGKEGGQGA